MEIQRTPGVSGPTPIEGKRVESAGPTQSMGTPGVADRVEISEAARLLAQVRNVPEMRMDRIAELKRQIESGEYETEEKLRVAVDRFLEEIRGK